MQFTMIDPSNPSATPQDILQKFMVMAAVSPGVEGDEVDELSRIESIDPEEDDDDNDLETSDETEEPGNLDVSEKKRRKLRLKKLKRKTKARAYEFTGGSDVVGIVFVEICRITDLPPEKNSKLSAASGTRILTKLSPSDKNLVRYGSIRRGLFRSQNFPDTSDSP